MNEKRKRGLCWVCGAREHAYHYGDAEHGIPEEGVPICDECLFKHLREYYPNSPAYRALILKRPDLEDPNYYDGRGFVDDCGTNSGENGVSVGMAGVSIKCATMDTSQLSLF